MATSLKTLDKLAVGEHGVIESFTDTGVTLKLIEMGCLPGEKITMDSIAPFGDPIAIHVCGYKLSIRKIEASSVVIRQEVN